MSLSGAETVDHLLNRIGEVDQPDDGLHCVIEVNPDAMALAMTLDAERRDGHVRSPLHGTPILIKDNIDTGDRMQTTAGSLALIDSPPSTDAPVVARLREAGLLILGKTNLSEWANFRSPHSTSGWSARGGLTHNPWDRTRSAGGSSSGSGAAVAAGLAPLAIGTETDGSITCPASFNGVVGLKPTVGLLPRDGIVPVSRSQDSPGPLAPDVTSIAQLMDVLCETTAHVNAIRETSLPAGLRIGVLRAFFGTHPGADDAADIAIQQLSQSGAVVVDDLAYPEAMGALEDDEMTVLLCEFKDDLNGYLAKRAHPVIRTIDDVIAFNTDRADTELKWFGQEFLEQSAATQGRGDSRYQPARGRGLSASRDNGIDALLREHDLAALVAPAFPPAPTVDLVNGDSELGGAVTTAPSVAGYPILTVPVGLVHGLPVGLAMTGTAHSELTLLTIAAALESALGLVAGGGLTPQVGG